MITKEQYLEAKKIVDAYKLQLKQARVIGNKLKRKTKTKQEGKSFFKKWDEVIKKL